VVAALVVGVLLHRERKPEPAMTLLEPIEGAVPAAEAAHDRVL
jgi:hypothetical protein